MEVNLGQLSVPELVMVAGAAVVAAGLLSWFTPGRIKITFFGKVRLSMPGSARAGQAIAAFGSLILAAGLLAQVRPAAPASSPLAGGRTGGGIYRPARPTSPGDVSPSPAATMPTAAASGAHLTITAPGGSADLGRDVVASGGVGTRQYSCYAVGWYVENTEHWTGYFIARQVRPIASGAFRSSVLQMGSPGETGSSWWPFLLGGTAAGCSWLHQLWARTPTGEYHDSFPPPGTATLYRSRTAIHRTT